MMGNANERLVLSNDHAAGVQNRLGYLSTGLLFTHIHEMVDRTRPQYLQLSTFGIRRSCSRHDGAVGEVLVDQHGQDGKECHDRGGQAGVLKIVWGFMNTILNIITWTLITAGCMFIAILIGLAFFALLELLNDRR